MKQIVYARHETRVFSQAERERCVAVYEDETACKELAVFRWNKTIVPTKQSRYVLVNGRRCRLKWIDPLAFQCPEPSAFDELFT